MTHPRLIAAMSNPGFYPHNPPTVELVQTHISYVFIAGGLVYKVKKPVDFGFLDFTTLEKRRENCLKEVSLNRRLAPETYLGVEEITEDEDGSLALGSSGRVIEYAVKMKKLPADGMLVKMLAEDRVTPGAMDEIARKLANFHGSAETGGEIDRFGSIEVIRRNHDENFEQTAPFIDRTIGKEQYGFLRLYVNDFLERKRSLLEERVSRGRIRDCHGDLHAEHICLTDGIVIYDCIEFNDRFRYSDAAADVAFLAMDLDYRGYPDHSRAFVEAYVRHSADGGLRELLPFYECYYAYVRGKVIGFRLDDPAISGPDKETARLGAANYFELAAKYAARPEKPIMVVMTGLMGSGKSVLAASLAPFLDAEVIRTDILRKELLNIRPEERHLEKFGEGIYSPELTARTYEKAFERARAALGAGRSAIIDGSFKKNADRIAALRIAQGAGAGFFVVECECAVETVRERLERRLEESRDASDGRWELYELQRADYEPVSSLPAQAHIKADTCLGRQSALYGTLSRVRFPETT